jgi:D-sedoheptulose 7-phosphate isomerase
MSYAHDYLREAKSITGLIDPKAVEKMVDIILIIRENKGRLFFLGVGGGAGNASHAVNDFRKIAGIESYSPTDNVSELTARINDDGWESTFSAWLKGSNLNSKDGVFVFSVGGGNQEKNVSVNLVKALEYAKQVHAKVLGVVGRDGGYTGKVADGCVIIPTVNPSTVTPNTESFQSVIWHLIVSHPRLIAAEMKWESVSKFEEQRQNDQRKSRLSRQRRRCK